ncbi:MAG TPA: oligogalacturonate lyase family protein [Pirellulales bacterium]|nr:oligogalacturonate lyase family protein [Pirellulales bacterium]
MRTSIGRTDRDGWYLVTRLATWLLLLPLLLLAIPARAAEEATANGAAAPATATASTTTAAATPAAIAEPPTDWIDPATGHRIIRLTREPDSASLYFHQNAYTDDGKLLVTVTPPRPAGSVRRPLNGPNDPLDGGAEQHDRGIAPPADAANNPSGSKSTSSDSKSAASGDSKSASSSDSKSVSSGDSKSAPADGSAPTGGRQGRGGFFRPTTLDAIDLSTLGVSPPKIDKLADGFLRGMVVGKKSGNVYYIRTQMEDGVRVDKVFATNMTTHETREIGKLPFRGGSGLAVNADETLLGGSYAVGGDLNTEEEGRQRSTEQRAAAPGDANSNADMPRGGNADPDASQRQIRTFGSREQSIAERYAAHRPMKLFTMDIKTGETQTFHPSTDWLNHVQFSQTDPMLMMFCHEGPWHLVDRIWTIHPGSDEAKLMHPRTMPNEIAGHEFFGYDGKTVWYDLQTPRSDKFWLAGVNVDTGERLRYPLERSQWSVHYNQSHDGKLFAGDGGGPGSVANRTPLPDNKPLNPPGNGQWIYLFTPVAGEMDTMQVGGETVKIGKFKAEKLVDMSKHNYEFEPNLTFTPDNKWIVFRSNMHGPVHTYAVEIAKAQ